MRISVCECVTANRRNCREEASDNAVETTEHKLDSPEPNC
jgi:hypothetical protein